MKFYYSLIVCFLLASCGAPETRSLHDYMSAFLNENTTIVAFGKADINTILEKSQYRSIPKLGLIVDQELKEYKKSLNTETPIYFALEGPFEQDGTPKTTYAFFEVKNADSLSQKLMQQGFDIEQSGKISYFQSGDVSFGISNNLAVLISKKEEFNGKELIEKTFDKISDDLSEGNVNAILDAKGDVVMGINLGNLYGTSNTDLQKLSSAEQEKIKQMMNGSFVQTSLSFENGALIMDMKNMFSDELKHQLFFKSDPSARIVSKLGTGNPRLGFAMNLDMKKLQSMLNEYAPNAMDDLAESMGGMASFVLATGGDAALSNLLSGELGIVMVGEPTQEEGISDFNFYVGLGPNGKMFASQAKTFLSAGMAQVDLNNKGLAAYSSKDHVPVKGKKLSIPKGCDSFGKKGITAFVNLDGVDLSSFELEGEEKLLGLIKYVSFEMDENGARLYIKAKEGKENVLKQTVDLMINEFSSQIGNMAI